MICASCGTENRAGRRFCLNCGTALAAGCPNCGAENEPQARFCGNCGHALAAAPAQAVAGTAGPRTSSSGAERRLVTVLFADLVGFTPFAEERDAEDVRDTLQRYSDIARDVVGRYGGTVEKFIGDAVMAVWGTPTAHEDDAERAVRAALELTDAVRSLGAEIQARAGVMTGEAAVTVGATDQALLAGDLVNTAARLQSVAPPGTVLVGEATMRAASAALAFEPAGEQALKGKAAPVAAWRALRVVAQRRGAGRAETFETPFVGRDEEFRLLRDQLQLTGRDPRARLVSVTGPAGIGKSRLAWELEKYIDGVVETIYWHRGRCPAYGEGVSFWALGEMVRRRAGLAEHDDEATTRQRVSATVAEYVGEASERDWIEQALLVLLGAEQQSQSGRETLFAAWRRFFEHVATRGTTVLVFEDLHWADAGLLDFIDHILDWSKQASLLVVTLARPELFDRRPDWGAARRTYSAIALEPLPEAHMRAILSALAPDLPESAIRLIVARADGIPLYAVETVRMLLADGRLVETDGHYRPVGELGDLEVPASLRSLITSRLDGLEQSDRQLIRDASVLGQSFSVSSLAEVTGIPADQLDGRLRLLVRRELLTLELDPRSPERGQFAFMQSLIREVAYSTLARPERRERHLAAARQIEAAGADELAGVLAGHYLAAYEASAAGPEADAVAAQARLALRGAADRAAALGGHRQAAEFLQQALAVTVTPADRAALLERQANELATSGQYERSDEAARAAIDAYQQVGDITGVARTRGIRGRVMINSARVAPAIAELEQALSELPGDSDPAVRADVLAKLSRAYYRNTELDRAMATADQALEIAEHHRLLATLAEAMCNKGTALQMAGRVNEALALLRGGLALARRAGDVETALRAGANLMEAVATEESASEALAIAREAVQLARAVGDMGQTVWNLGNAALAAAYAGVPLGPILAEIDEMLALDLEQSDHDTLISRKIPAAALAGQDAPRLMAELEASARAKDPQGPAAVAWVKSFVAIATGDYDAAAALVASATELSANYGAMGLAALLAANAGDVSEAGRYLARANELPVVGRTDVAGRGAAEAAVSALEGRRNDALIGFREALREFTELEDVFDGGMVALTMVRVLGAAEPEARAAGELALAAFEHMGAVPLVAQMRAALAGSVGPLAAQSDAPPSGALAPVTSAGG